MDAPSSRLERVAAVRQSSKAWGGWKRAFGTGCALALVWLAVVSVRLHPSSRPLTASWVEISPPHQRFAARPAPALSPDGRQIAFWAADQAGKVGLWVRSLDSPVARLLTGTSLEGPVGGFAAFWSPDGRSLGFFAERRLKRIDVSTGTPLILADGEGLADPVDGGAPARRRDLGEHVQPLRPGIAVRRVQGVGLRARRRPPRPRAVPEVRMTGRSITQKPALCAYRLGHPGPPPTFDRTRNEK